LDLQRNILRSSCSKPSAIADLYNVTVCLERSRDLTVFTKESDTFQKEEYTIEYLLKLWFVINEINKDLVIAFSKI